MQAKNIFEEDFRNKVGIIIQYNNSTKQDASRRYNARPNFVRLTQLS